jgi:hypothetical protein
MRPQAGNRRKDDTGQGSAYCKVQNMFSREVLKGEDKGKHGNDNYPTSDAKQTGKQPDKRSESEV